MLWRHACGRSQWCQAMCKADRRAEALSVVLSNGEVVLPSREAFPCSWDALRQCAAALPVCRILSCSWCNASVELALDSSCGPRYHVHVHVTHVKIDRTRICMLPVAVADLAMKAGSTGSRPREAAHFQALQQSSMRSTCPFTY